MKEVCASGAAFAALKADQSVVTWGHRDYGGDSRAVRDQLWSVDLMQCDHGMDKGTGFYKQRLEWQFVTVLPISDLGSLFLAFHIFPWFLSFLETGVGVKDSVRG